MNLSADEFSHQCREDQLTLALKSQNSAFSWRPGILRAFVRPGALQGQYSESKRIPPAVFHQTGGRGQIPGCAFQTIIFSSSVSASSIFSFGWSVFRPSRTQLLI